MADAGFSFRERATLLLSNLEEGREVRTYLQQFSRSNGGCFAVIKVGGALVAEECAALAERLALLQALELKPIVVLGAGPQLDARLTAAGIKTERRDNLRVTPDEAIAIVAEEAAATGLSLVKAVGTAGGSAVLAPPATVKAEPLDEEKYGRVGRAIGVNAQGIDDLLHTRAIPLICCVGQDSRGRLLNVNADDVAREVARAVSPQKIVFLTSTGGLLDEKGAIIDSINLQSDYDRLMAEDWIHSGMALKLSQIKSLLDDLPPSSSVSMTDTSHLMRELFTHGGAGTLIRQGEAIISEPSPDTDKLTTLINGAFGRTLRDDFWQTADLDFILHSERYRAAAVVTRLGGISCLDKFAVSVDARGEGLAKAVWRELAERAPRLIWRSRPNNPFNAFYTAVADGFIRRDPWFVFWCGTDLDDHIVPLASELAARPADFVENAK
ncbi:acetylglutamate kinase [Parvularcula sp. LCG005]|uniref:acetylglutamate kinase n=1 Tax=Parvularcula sp. LCG005 TaxID=3078805 RepID=UPI002943E9B9|nr:acetylglutamate kinase [Parvularcula sp. LCG005]WOI53059.1 acetylglutamate kinase [Parvularcula sp. LCG005]